MKISEILNKYKTDKNNGHHYGESYDQIFSKFERIAPLDILEIGVQKGGSLVAWKEYFPNSKITGIDIKDEVLPEYRKDFNYIVTDVKEYRTDQLFDIIIDDGSHFLRDVVFSVCYFAGKLKDNGVLIIEDVQNPELWVGIIHHLIPKECRLEVYDLRNINNQYDDYLITIWK